MRFHLLGPAHIPVAWERCCGRIAALVWNMAKMLKRHGQEVVLYGSAGTDAPCDEFVEIVGPETLRTECRPGHIASVTTGSGALQIGLQTPSSRRSTSDDPSPAKWNWEQHAELARPASLAGRPAWIEHRARGRLE